jgi:hypothetical protein
MAQRLKIAGNLADPRSVRASDVRREERHRRSHLDDGRPRAPHSWFDGPYFEELEVSDRAVDLSRMNNGAAVLNAHGTWDVNDVIGVVERAWIDGKRGPRADPLLRPRRSEADQARRPGQASCAT